MAKASTEMVRLPAIEKSLWASYKVQGDFAFHDPKSGLADKASGMVHVNLADWDIVTEDEYVQDADQAGPKVEVVDVTLRAKNTDDEGRRT